MRARHASSRVLLIAEPLPYRMRQLAVAAPRHTYFLNPFNGRTAGKPAVVERRYLEPI